MAETPDFDNMSIEEMYEDQTLIDGTVYYLDYFHHAMYLLSAMQVTHDSLVKLEKKTTKNLFEHRSMMGLFFNLIFLTSQVIENLIKARSLYDLKVTGKWKKFTTLKTVQQKYWKCGGHEVGKIINSSNISITEDEKKLLEQIEPFFIWGGRYPHPFLRKDYVKNMQNNRQVSFSANTIKILEGMFDRFVDDMELGKYLKYEKGID